MELNLKIVTLNCWGIPVISKDRKPRMEAIAKQLATKNYDIVCLQEVWSNSDYDLITNSVKNVLPYCHYFYSGVIGSGICILSKYPFKEVFFHAWPVNGYVHKLQHGDWFGGKGVGLCTLKINNYNINVYSAHLHAEYDRNCDEYMAHRVLQAFDTAQFIRLTGASADLVVLAGDLNTEPGDLAYRILISATGLQDSFLQFSDKIGKHFATNESFMNSYTDSKLIAEKFDGKRIDYILYRISNNLQINLKDYNHPLPARVPGQNYSYSDHEAVCCNLIITQHRNGHSAVSELNKNAQDIISQVFGAKEPNIVEENLDYKAVLMETQTVFDIAIHRLNYHRKLYWFLTTFLFFMLFVTMEMDAPFNFTKVYHVVRLLVTGILCFTLIMASLWNNIEYNAVLAGKLNMDICLKQLMGTEKDKKI